MQNNRNLLDEGANPLKDLTHANLNEPLKQHNTNAVKLVQTVRTHDRFPEDPVRFRSPRGQAELIAIAYLENTHKTKTQEYTRI
ncbi:hypothetical protein TSAR_014470 [Trichomalopsis sarcophagae]|uniref:Uncharacterized protein n=1 Tax=Trichomalopsis sarcophagae TaxID=543379 RepID=A0A232F9F9_9HYME|nr:hypothetical protein TSAR_014470 [Trichomalopsis sarcophagae]